MKKLFIKDIKDYLEREISELFYVKEVTYSLRDGTKWQDLHLMDVSGFLIGKCWSENMKEEYLSYEGKIVRVFGRVELYRDVYGIRVVDVKPVSDKEYSLDDFQLRLSGEAVEQLWTRMDELVSTVTDKRYQALLQAVFTVNRKKLFENLPGDCRNHHVFTGGWLRHTVEVAEIALFLSDLCKGSPVELIPVNRDLLITGSLLFDVGRINSFTQRLVPSNNVRGNLVGYVQDSLIFISCTNNTLPDYAKVSDLTQLLHIISSAHLQSDKKPMIKEALIINSANIAAINYAAYDELFYNHDKWHPEEMEKRQIYSSYFQRDMVRIGKGGINVR